MSRGLTRSVALMFACHVLAVFAADQGWAQQYASREERQFNNLYDSCDAAIGQGNWAQATRIANDILTLSTGPLRSDKSFECAARMVLFFLHQQQGHLETAIVHGRRAVKLLRYRSVYAMLTPVGKRNAAGVKKELPIVESIVGLDKEGILCQQAMARQEFDAAIQHAKAMVTHAKRMGNPAAVTDSPP